MERSKIPALVVAAASSRTPDDSGGFTLVELMVVVAIIGILAAIAIPNLVKFRLRAVSAEADSVLAEVRAAELAFAGKWNAFARAPNSPATGGFTGQKSPWTGGGGYDLVGFEAAGRLYHQYHVILDPGGAAEGGWNNTSFGAPVSSARIGSDDTGYPCTFQANCNNPPASGLAKARPGTDDITIKARGDIDNDGFWCYYATSDKNLGNMPYQPNPGQSCGDDFF